ncbi:MAG: glycosyltransferase [Phycisphaerales bacterium]
MPLRILHISTRLILGGSQENTVLSCEGQARRGHEVHLAFGPIFGPEGSMLDRVRAFRTDDDRAIETHELRHLIRPVNPFADHVCFHHELRPLIRRLRPDIVHTHSSKAGILGRWAAWKELARMAREERCGIVHTVHGPPFMPVDGGMFSRSKTRLVNMVYTHAERFAARRCHAIVCVADAMRDEFLRRGIGRPEQYVTVRSGIDLTPFTDFPPYESREPMRASLGFTSDDFVIGTVARLAQHKGHDDLLDALGQDLKANPSWRLLWVGDGWWRGRLVAKAWAMGIGVRELDREVDKKVVGEGDTGGTPVPRVGVDERTHPAAQLVLTGLVPPTRVPGLMRAMDILAHPSSREGLPRTVPQALLAGEGGNGGRGVCPVAYDADGTREACIEMQTGRLVPVGDILGLREAIAWCAANPQERQRLAGRGRAICLREFGSETMVERLEAVYERAMVLARA